MSHASEPPKAGNLTGSLLVASPGLLDPNFRRTILFLSHHHVSEGATGFILNRPTQKTISDISAVLGSSEISTIPLYVGGPVANENLVLAALGWDHVKQAVQFETFGPDDDAEVPSNALRAFIGYAGWTKGQLESEIAQKSWFVVRPTRELIEMSRPQTAWRDLLRSMDPLLKLLADAPDDPSLN